MTAARILIVEDEQLVARDIQKRLQRFGYEVVGLTGSGEQATIMAREMRPDLVLMDIHLQGEMDGVTVAEIIRRDSGAPVVYLTAYADDDTLQRARVTEPFGYILKPFEERELRTTIEMALYRHDSERKLRESEHRYAVTLGSIGDGVIATDTLGNVTFMNPVAEKLTGWSFGEARKQPLDRVFPLRCEDTGQPAVNPVARVLASGAVVGLANHTQLVARDGHCVPIDDSGAPIRDDNGAILGAVLVFHDVSARREVEAQLRRAEQEYRTIFENAVEGLFRASRDGQLERANPALARILGHASPAELTASVSDLNALLCADENRRQEYRRLLAERGMVKHFECQGVQRDGTRVWLSLSVRELAHPVTGEPCHEGSVEEITGRIRLEEEVRQAQKMEAIGRLAGGVAHDFNNLLTVILSYCEILQRRVDHELSLREGVAVIREAAESAASLTQQLLTFGRKQAAKAVTIDLNQLVSSLQRMLSRLIGEDVVLLKQLDPELWPVTVDPSQMERVIVNLVVNARDAMPGGGRLTIRTVNQERGADSNDAAGVGGGRWVLLTVEDTGCGMDSATLARLFEPFFTTKEVGKGTGLGLATVYAIVRQSDGHVRVDSQVGCGTRFSIWLPASDERAVTAPLPAPEPEQLEGGATILVVEDDPGIRRIARRALEDAGCRVLEASNGREALELCRGHSLAIDLVLTDVVMPEMSGFELAKQLKVERPQCHVLYMSGYMGSTTASQMSGTEHLLPKPFTPNELLKRVQDMLRS